MNVILDACVLYSAPLRDFLLNLADLDTFNPKWTTEINQEWLRNLLKNRKDLRQQRLLRTIDIMNLAFPEANIIEYENTIDDLELPDEDDRHVLAAALKSKAKFILTFNIKDFPEHIMNKYNIKAIHPDDFIVYLIKENENIVAEAFINLHNSLTSPACTKKELMSTLEGTGLKESMKSLGSYT